MKQALIIINLVLILLCNSSIAQAAKKGRYKYIKACEESIKQWASIPESVDLHYFFNPNWIDRPDGTIKFISTFTFKTLLGVKLKRNISCVFKGNEMLNAKIW